eukprot:Nitzschia sp. Nitz4//scaffold3_size479765//447923//451003//NITZ4_000189-RA/size479765-augustus-gene-1.629-mRNA-1//-1//CDS//3329551025//7008//frame0
MRGLFGRKKSSLDDSSSGKRRKKKKKSRSPIDDDYPQETKRKKIKKMRLGLKKRKKNKDKDSGRGKPRGTYDEEYDGGGGFQLDNVTPGMRTFDRTKEAEIMARQNAAGDANKKFRVKPFHAFPSPVYLTEAEMYSNMLEPSDEFEFLTSYLNPSTKATRRLKPQDIIRRNFGSPKDDGRIGSLRVEVLGCVGLDRLKPEVAVYLVVGDCAFATDIVSGARSPMWPSTSKRAAVFPLHHAYARMFAGVFDVTKKNEADTFCGRIAVDIPPLRPNTEYDVSFPIRVSSFIYDRRPRGVVRLRFTLHWFSERHAILSYLRRPRNPLAFSRQAKKQPTIPCGDPKTFRNVAVTVHGQDFPGKYTRGAFRATMREFNLYQQNVRFLFKYTIIDCIFYENPLMSLYLFSTSMYCVYLNSVRLVPPFFIGWLIYLLYESYLANNVAQAGHLGYKPLTIMEVFYGLLRDGKGNKVNFQPIMVKKRPRRSVRGENGEVLDIELANHREFPFSERFKYHKFAASDAIAGHPTKQKKKGKKGSGMSCMLFNAKDSGDDRTARRLSVYTVPVDDNDQESEDEGSSSEESSEGGDRDEEGMMEQGDDGYGDVGDSDDEEDSDEEENRGARKRRLLGEGEASRTRRILEGPEQNSDKSGKKQMPQVHLSKVEHMLHRATKNISVEHVHFPSPQAQTNLDPNYNAKGPAGDVMTAKEKQNFDEFDRLLGYRSKNLNPILRITSSFLGPLMRIIRIVVYATRIAFNVSAWTDPFLTFWVFAFLVTSAIVLLIFPWRVFFFTSTLVLLGPQNIAVRKYMERRRKEKDLEKQAKEEQQKEEAKRLKAQQAQEAAQNALSFKLTTQVTAAKDEASVKSSKKKKFGFFGRGKRGKEAEAVVEEANAADGYHSPRPAFYANGRPTRGNQVPRDVAVPYFRFRKDRFYDWPPDPTVSRATPLLGGAEEQEDDDYDDMSYDGKQYAGDEGMRRRRPQSDEFDDDFGYG